MRASPALGRPPPRPFFGSSLTQPPFPQVIGVGGGGSNAVNRMLASDLRGVDLYVINTDAQVRGRAG